MSAVIAEALPTRFKLTVEQYHRTGEAGILHADDRIELIDGELIRMAPIGSLHAGLVSRLARLLIERPDITAIFAGDDDVAAGALLALKAAGKLVPEDVSLLGFDDNFHARHLTPGLTTVRQPVDEAGRVATRLLLAILDGEPVAPVITIPTELILRHSIGPVRGLSPTSRHVAPALTAS